MPRGVRKRPQGGPVQQSCDGPPRASQECLYAVAEVKRKPGRDAVSPHIQRLVAGIKRAAQDQGERFTGLIRRLILAMDVIHIETSRYADAISRSRQVSFAPNPTVQF